MVYTSSWFEILHFHAGLQNISEIIYVPFGVGTPTWQILDGNRRRPHGFHVFGLLLTCHCPYWQNLSEFLKTTFYICKSDRSTYRKNNGYF